MDIDKYVFGECWQCKKWKTSQQIFDIYGEGCGICTLDNNTIRFCHHKCSFCIPNNSED